MSHNKYRCRRGCRQTVQLPVSQSAFKLIWCRLLNSSYGCCWWPINTSRISTLKPSGETEEELLTYSMMVQTEQQKLEQLEHCRVQEEQARRSHWEHGVLDPWLFWQTQQPVWATVAPKTESRHPYGTLQERWTYKSVTTLASAGGKAELKQQPAFGLWVKWLFVLWAVPFWKVQVH